MNLTYVEEKETISIDQAANYLRISTATVRNWIKHNYLTPVTSTNKMRFLVKDVHSLKENLTNGNINRLRKRANKQKSGATFLPSEYLSDPRKTQDILNALNLISQFDIPAEESLFFLAINLLSREGLVKPTNEIDDLLSFRENLFPHRQVMQEMQNWAKEISFKSTNDFRSQIIKLTIPQVQDFLGMVYQSLSCEGKKSQSGSYYTPSQIVEDVIADYVHSPNEKVLDPCCGTGQYLLIALDHLLSLGAGENALQNIWGIDIDGIAVHIARINVLIKCKNQDGVSPNIFCKNTLLEGANDFFQVNSCIQENSFNLIITNPPWGAQFSIPELRQLNSLFPRIHSGESFSYFIEKGFQYLKEGGILSYILPESFLNVKTHNDIRKTILNRATIKKIQYLNRAFKNVFTPAIRLDIKKTVAPSTHKIKIRNGKNFDIEQKRFSDNNNSEFHINIEKKDSAILDKIFTQDHTTLTNHADWALGIVTGNNLKFLSTNKLPGHEGVLTGKEIFKFNCVAPKRFIKFEPKKLQQVAPEEKYRAGEKLIYRFISKELIFSYDNQQLLTLNSANILIPRIARYPIKAILGLFNSSLYQYIFQKKFNSIKILRGQIESLPLPNWADEQINKITLLTSRIIKSGANQNNSSLFQELDVFIMSQWGLSNGEIALIRDAINHKKDK